MPVDERRSQLCESRDCFLPMLVASAACQTGRGDTCGTAGWVQVSIGLQAEPGDMPLLKLCTASTLASPRKM